MSLLNQRLTFEEYTNYAPPLGHSGNINQQDGKGISVGRRHGSVQNQHVTCELISRMFRLIII